MKIEKIKPDMTVYDCHSQKMGNTTVRSLGIWTVKIVSVDVEKRVVRARWNGNEERSYFQSSYSKWTEKKPILIRTHVGGWRKMTKEEKAAAKIKSTTGGTNS